MLSALELRLDEERKKFIILLYKAWRMPDNN